MNADNHQMTQATTRAIGPRARRRSKTLAALVTAGVLVLTGCTIGGDPTPAAQVEQTGAPQVDPTAAPPPIALGPLEPGDSLTPNGIELAADVDWATRPAYQVAATLDPASGRVDGTMLAKLPVGADDAAVFRFFAGLDELAPDAKITAVRVDGEPAELTVDQSLLTLPLPTGHGEVVEIHLEFGYTLEPMAPADPFGGLLGGSNLEPSAIGLLARHEQGLSLGHWFPLWMPSAEGALGIPDGFGDIGNFPAGLISAELTVPEGATVVTGGVRVDETPTDGSLVVRDEGVGLRDLGAMVLLDTETVTEQVGGVTVAVVGPGGDAESDAILAEVLTEATTSLRALEAAFGAYPWQELDVIAAPLGSGVGGMEWPGAVWIEQEIFAGGIPGLGALDLDGLLGEDSGEFGDLFEELLGEGGLGGLLDPGVLENMRSWTIAHEIGHQWWHAMVGNDSTTSPAVDEPLAQYSACVVFDAAYPEVAESVCAFNTTGTYQQMRMLGIPDAPAAQASNAFDSSLQYGGVVYGKAPGLYLALEETYGQPAMLDALRAFVAAHPFALVDTDQLNADLGAALGDPAAVDALWQRWFNGAHGDEDIGVLEGGLGGLPGLDELLGEGGDQADLETLLEELLGGSAG